MLGGEFDLTSNLGAYLYREVTFRPGGLIASMASEVLDVYLDSTGKRKSEHDKLIIVNGCVSTPEKWRDFNIEWQETLNGYKFKPTEKGRFVFHTTDFQSSHCKHMPSGLSPLQKQQIYRHLVEIVRKHSLCLISYGIVKKDYERFNNEYPNITRFWLGKPGTFISVLTNGKIIEWARNNGYSETVSLMFDQGDEFWGEMHTAFIEYLKDPSNRHFGMTPDSLLMGDKITYSPIQAADIVAWECRKYFLKVIQSKLSVSGRQMRPEMRILSSDQAFFTCWEYRDLVRRTNELINADLRPGESLTINELEASLKSISDKRDAKGLAKKERQRAIKQANYGKEKE